MRDKRMDSRGTDKHELLLIRVGHHLWNWRKQAIKNHNDKLGEEYLKCCQIVWALKEEIRVPLREKHLKSCQMRDARLSKSGFRKASDAQRA